MNNVNFASYADDNISYAIEDGEIQIIEFLKETSGKLFCWFANNYMKAIPDRCHLKYRIKRSECIKILGIKIDNKLNFTNHIDRMHCQSLAPTWTY